MKKVYTTKRAEISFYEIVDYLQDNWGNEEYDNLEEQTRKVIETIAHHPFAYPAIEKNKQIRRALVLNILSMYYRVYDDRIEVLLFWHNSRDPESLSL